MLAMLAYNTSVHEATNFTPYELVFGRVSRTTSLFPQGTELETYGSYLRVLLVEIIEIQKIAHENLTKAKYRSKEKYDKKIRPLDPEIGYTVYALKEIRDAKFDSRTTGPYTVTRFTENNGDILKTEDGKRLMKHKDKLLLSHY